MIALLYLGLLVVAFFLLVVRPQRRQVTAHRALVASLEVGDEIISSGGIYGTIRSMDDNALEVEIADGIVVRVARTAVASRLPRPGETTPDDGTGTGTAQGNGAAG
jgi:preprotein translocase subunit YajC